MKKYISFMINGTSLGISIGLVISLLFSYGYHLQNYVPSSPNFTSHFDRPLNSVLASVVLWGLMGLVAKLTMLIFKKENWSLRKRTSINFIVYYFGFMPLVILAGWFPFSILNLAIFSGWFILCYLAIWIINYKIVKRELHSINEKLKN
ncbi:DUF3021 family protein [Lactobacillus fermentum]|uniref:DUF3021 family protein n=2 Tax=Limosilactobacillus fermentum TaxID=1613 RepID=A0A843R300_LIMFE|nr:DUF3021 family protein [Limosilactobacillus fermentum]